MEFSFESLTSTAGKPESDMESAIKTMVTTFLSSTKGKESLDSQSFQKMIQNNLSGMMEDTDSKSAIKDMQQGLDDNSDGKVSFQEYLNLIGYLANSLSQKKCEQNSDS
ncbi:Protein S100-A16 [Oryzias melastigma]|uniref:Protein S100-A16 n=2 Tax=Oryzias melastigma TaxID=30732 RepID=A0A834L1J5_ORYME|nr:Protein S100-A16 [Oryzias melastigma]